LAALGSWDSEDAGGGVAIVQAAEQGGREVTAKRFFWSFVLAAVLTVEMVWGGPLFSHVLRLMGLQ
jgi:hypothetical protein